MQHMKLGIRKRFQFIEFQLGWEGSVGRKKIQDQFSISPQQATKDLTSYMESYPGNMVYDPRQKSYVPTEKFRPKLTDGEASEYLMHLEMLQHGYKDENEIWISQLPLFEAVSNFRRRIDAGYLKVLTKAIHEKSFVSAKYTSMRSSNTDDRTLQPRAIVSDGHRWHIRAYDFYKEQYSDFVLSRLSKVQPTNAPEGRLPEDEDWRKIVKVVLTADPELDAEQKKSIELEYEMEDGQLCIEVKKAMLFYYLRNFGFNPRETDDKKIRNKSSFLLSIKNLDEVEKCLGRRN